MSAVTALGKRPCPDCAGELEWNPGKKVLACPYCGFISKDQPKTGDQGITERDLEKALGETGDDRRGYGEQTTKVKCQNCHAISVFESSRVAQRCDFCGSPSVIAYQETRDAITPESLLPVQLDAPRVRDLVKNWVRTRWFAPDALQSGALTDTLKGIYIPYWTFDAKAHADWTAMSGDHYYTTERYTDSKGHSRTRQVRHTRWYPTSGQLDHFFDDALVTGTAGVRQDLLAKVEPFPTEQLRAYDVAFVRGWTVERYQIDLRKASELNIQDMNQKLRALCGSQVPGDTHRDLQVQATYAGRTFKHILVPVWLVTYTLGAQNYQVLVNGFTGAVAGDRPISWTKVFFYIILPAIIVLAILAITNAVSDF
jgi:hypothetical protein